MGGCSKATLQAIISHGADVNAVNNNGETALMKACKVGDTETLNVLLNAEADINIKNTMGCTLIHHAVLRGCSRATLQAIINHGADVNATEKNNMTALMIACIQKNEEPINVLLKAGANPNIAHARGQTAIHCAVLGKCSKEALQAIIDHGADVNAPNNNSVTALMTACQEGNVEAINILLDAGADPNSIEVYGRTCLHVAVIGLCSKEVLQKLIGHGVNVNARRKYDITALMIACMQGETQKRNIDVINVLLNAGADPNYVTVDGETCLHTAVRGHCSKEVLQKLMDHGVNVNVRSKYGETAIKIACLQGISQKVNIDAINALLNAGADLTLCMLW